MAALTDDLAQEVTTYIEEGLYEQAIDTLSTHLATTGRGSVLIPRPSQLSFIVTLSLHPRFTIHTASRNRLVVSSKATLYLSSLLTGGAASGDAAALFSEAYTFGDQDHGLMRGGRRRAPHLMASSDHATLDSLTSEYANAEGFFNRADDFWSAVGWAFNCSELHTPRWETWALWLNHMITLLENDFESQKASANQNWVSKTLLAQYIGTRSLSTKAKRIIRSVLADGTGSEFSEIWNDETVVKRKKASTRVKKKIDIEAGELGEYGENSSNEEGELLEPAIPSTDDVPGPGMSESAPYRMRLLALLFSLCHLNPESLVPLDTLIAGCTTHLRPLPLKTLRFLLKRPLLSLLNLEHASGLLQHLARSFLEAGAPINPSMSELDWPLICTYYAPYASTNTVGAATVGDNGKIALCIEQMVLLLRRDSPKPDREVWKAFESGCDRRLERSGSNARRAKKGEAGSEMDFEETKNFELSFLQSSKHRLALSLI